MIAIERHSPCNDLRGTDRRRQRPISALAACGRLSRIVLHHRLAISSRRLASRLARSVLAIYFTFAGLLAATPAVKAQHGNSPIEVTDLLNLRVLENVLLSPDGRQVLYSVRSIQNQESTNGAGGADYEYLSHLHVVDAVRPGTPRQLTRGDLSARDAAWHPDGDRLAFVRDVDGTPQVFILPLLGGEAYQVTTLESGASAPRWSPDGSRLLFASDLTARQIQHRINRGPDWPPERPGRQLDDTSGVDADPDGTIRQIRKWLTENEEKGNPRVFHRLNFQGETDLEREPTFRHWFVVETDSEQAIPVMVSSGFYHFAGGEWHSDGERIILSGKMSSDAHPDRVLESDLYMGLADGSGLSPLLTMEGYSLSSPAVSPDGRSIAFLARRTDDIGYAQMEIGVYELDEAGPPRLLTLDFDRSASAPRWSPEGWYLYFTAASDGGFPLYRVPAFRTPPRAQRVPEDVRSELVAADTTGDAPPADAEGEGEIADTSGTEGAVEWALPDAAAGDAMPEGGRDIAADSIQIDSTLIATMYREPQVERLTSFEKGIRSFDVGSAAVFYVATQVTNPYELYVSYAPFSTDEPLTGHNSAWIADKRLSVPQSYTVKSDSFEIQYWIMKPSFFEEDESYPLLHQIHGGPAAMWGPGEATMWHEFQFFTSRGYGIVYSNPRGSGGYGYEFKRANFRDWGAGPAADVLAVADEAATEAWVDTERQVVTGGSYAGYLTAWIAAHDHRFRAAVAQRGVYDLATFLGEGNAWRLIPGHFGGFPWEAFKDSLRAAPEEDPEENDLPVPAIAADTSASYFPAPPVAVDTSEAARGDNFDPMTVTARGVGRLEPLVGSTRSVADVLRLNSPITYVDSIRTPLLIIHADHDLRTGVIQSEMLYKSLKILERDVEYVRYPGSGHELSRSGDPVQRMDRILRIYEFMERFIE